MKNDAIIEGLRHVTDRLESAVTHLPDLSEGSSATRKRRWKTLEPLIGQIERSLRVIREILNRESELRALKDPAVDAEFSRMKTAALIANEHFSSLLADWRTDPVNQ